MKYINLENLCDYAKDKININKLNKKNYISTENMLPYKGGISKSAKLPSTNKTQAYMKNDILVSNIRPYFKKIWKSNISGGCSNDILVYRAKPKVSPDFLYYVLSNDSFFNYSMSTSKGTKMPRGDKNALMQYKCPNFEYNIQKKIAAILSALDDKIELNNKINKNLEEMAQAIFNSWFVDFEPWGGEMPDDWEYGTLDKIADFLNGLAMKKFEPIKGESSIPVLKIKELRQGFCDSSSQTCTNSIKSKYIIHEGDVIFSWSGSLMIDFWCGDTCGLNQHLFKVTSTKYDKWFYYLWTLYYLPSFIAISADKATTMGHIKRGDLSKTKVILPDVKTYKKISEILTPTFDSIINNRIENNKLTKLRDNLLSKLMSGELDVSNLDI
jgi:type I restriction enzyme S subunit